METGNDLRRLFAKMRAAAIARRLPLAIAAAALAAGIVYGNSLSGVFVYDDLPGIVNNPLIKYLPHLQAQLAALFNPDSIFVARPLTCLSFSLNYFLGGLNPAGYHAVNILLHMATAVLLFLLARKVVENAWGRHTTALPLIAALLYAVHPVHTEVVAYTYNRSASLMAVFYLLSLLLFVRATAEKVRRELLLLSLCSFGISFFAKQAAVTLPVMLLAYDLLFISNGEWRKLRSRLVYHLPYWLCLAGMVLFMNFWFKRGTAYAGIGFSVHSLAGILGNSVDVAKYLSLLFDPRGLCISHALPPARSLADPRFLAVLAFPLGIAAAAYRWYRARSGASAVVLFGLTWFAGNLFPIFVYSVPFGERHLYLASFGLAVAALGLFARLLDGNRVLAAALLALCPALLWGTMTLQRNTLYRNVELLWQDAAAKYPDSYEPHVNLAVCHAARGDNEGALAEYRTAYRLNPRSERLHYGLTFLYLAQGDLAKAEQAMRTTLALDPDGAKLGKDQVYGMCGAYYAYAGRFALAEDYFRRSLAVNPFSADTHGMLGYLLFIQGNMKGALAEYRTALAYEPGAAQPHYYLGSYYFVHRQYDAAVREYETFLRSCPRHRKAAELLALARRMRERQTAMEGK